MEYKLKTLEATHIFPMVGLIKKFGVSNFKKLAESFNVTDALDEDGNMNMEQFSAMVGINIVFDILAIIIDNLENCETEIYSFLAKVSDLKVNEIKSMPMDQFAEMVLEVLTKDEFVGFFKVALKYVK